MEVSFDEVALEDLEYWKKSGNTVIQPKIQRLLLNIIESPYSGIGKPERLKYDLEGSWSRRINKEHRIVYSAFENSIQVHSLRGHYK
jgi:toxin YoeB